MSRAQDLALVALARQQRGLLTAAQLRGTTGRDDEPARRLRSGWWQEVLPGVVAPAARPLTSDDTAAAAMLWNPLALLSHHDAARLEGIWVPDADQTWVSVPWESPRRTAEGVRLVRTRHLPATFRTDGFLRWTLPARTVVDLGMCLTRAQLDAVLLSAIRKEKTSAAEVLAELPRLEGRAGLQLVRRVASLWAPERESLLEDRLHEHVRSATELRVTRQVQVHDGRGNRVARVDVAVEELRLAFEADGLLYHSTDEQMAHDQGRDRTLMRLGWQTVRYREGSLEHRERVRREVAGIIERRRRDLRAA